MTSSDITRLRLHSQQLAEPPSRTVQELVGWMGAMQAQDYPMAQWAMGIRLPGHSCWDIQSAVDEGRVIRTHVLRPTWHVVSAMDIYWMLALTGSRIKAVMRSRHKVLEITEAVTAKTNRLFEKALEGGRYLSRDALVAELQQAGIATEDNRAAHLLMLAELDGLLGSGPQQGSKPTYALLEERVPKSSPLLREEAVSRLAHTYFSSHGPATLADFVWWSGLTLTDARRGLEGVRASLLSATVEDQTYWFDPAFSSELTDEASVYLLPAFDEYIISYKDRRAVLAMEHHKKAVSQNGVFWPVILVQGQVAGTWKRGVKKGKVLLETCFFRNPSASVRDSVQLAAQAYARFLNLTPELTHTTV